jgi:hypothetical protein
MFRSGSQVSSASMLLRPGAQRPCPEPSNTPLPTWGGSRRRLDRAFARALETTGRPRQARPLVGRPSAIRDPQKVARRMAGLRKASTALAPRGHQVRAREQPTPPDQMSLLQARTANLARHGTYIDVFGFASSRATAPTGMEYLEGVPARDYHVNAAR